MADSNPQEAEAELEAFRRRWREEVARKQKKHGETSDKSTHESKNQRRKSIAPPPSSAAGSSSLRRSDGANDHDDFAPQPYHDLPDKEEQLKLGKEGQSSDRNISNEPESALEHYEHAVEKETHGNLRDSLHHYRTAFRLDDGVHELYKKKHFPPSFFAKPKPTASSATASNTTRRQSVHSRDNSVPATLKQLVEEFSTLRIAAAPPPTDASPQQPSPLAELPEEILTHILADLAQMDVASFARTAQVCKRLAYLVLTEEAIWKRVALGDAFGFAAMHYDYACDIMGLPIEEQDDSNRFLGFDEDELDEEHPVDSVPLPEQRAIAWSNTTERLLHDQYASSWRRMFRTRPRIRFNGCYISTVNYTRPGAQSSNSLVWGNSVHVVTYFRYLRFFRDGTVISLLTTAEPADVVHHLVKENLHANHGTTLPSSVMKDALRGRWRLCSPLSSRYARKSALLDGDAGENAAAAAAAEEDSEIEGDVHVETEGVVQRYTYRMLLALSHAGKGARNNKLAWKGFWSHNRLTDDWGEFGLRNDRAFYWSRVKSYRMGYQDT